MEIGNIKISNRTIYEIVGGVAIATLMYLGASYVTKTKYLIKLKDAAIELKEKENTVNVWKNKYELTKKDLDAAKKKISELEKEVKQGVSIEELKNACIEGEITRDAYKKLKKYTQR